jgi:general secretion pathway protein G
MLNRYLRSLKALADETRRDERGFTLTEMLIVIALIALIGTFVAGNVIDKFSRAKVDSTKVQMRNLSTVLDQFKLDCGFYPLSDQGLDALLKKPAGRECKNYDPNGYLKSGSKVPRDSWSNDFGYQSDGNKFVITSFGSDGKEGGEGNDKDIASDQLD